MRTAVWASQIRFPAKRVLVGGVDEDVRIPVRDIDERAAAAIRDSAATGVTSDRDYGKSSWRFLSAVRVALIHDWLVGMRGGEKCLEAFCELFPRADLYTLIYIPEKVSAKIRAMNVRPSWLGRLPGIERLYRYALPLFPTIVERMRVQGYDLVLSSSHCVAKGVFPDGARHVAYVHAPMRYVWDQYRAYFGPEAPALARAGMALWRSYLQRWDIRSSARVDRFVANSNHVAAKIKKIYGRDAAVIHPPVDIERFFIRETQEPFFLVVSGLVPYKRIDIAIAAFNELGLPLKIAGDGPLRRRLEKQARRNIEFLGWVEGEALAELYASCQALVFPGEEDFGITPLEAQASGRPVIAYGRGGARESVIGLGEPAEPDLPPTGIFFEEQTAGSLIDAVERYRQAKGLFDPQALRARASLFSRERFKERIRNFLEAEVGGRSEGEA
jgi:glycosyltransferase involved in cell wall biosynthesis